MSRKSVQPRLRKLDDLLEQGIHYIEDARFVRDRFVPIAVSKKCWNIAVYEAHRATELLVRGMICQVGFEPEDDHHNIKRHLSFLCDRLPGARHSRIPFTIGAYTDPDAKQGYGIILEGTAENSIDLYCVNSGVYTSIASRVKIELPKEGRIDLKLDVNAHQVAVYFNGSLVGGPVSHSTHAGPFKIVDRSFVRRPDTDRIRLLKKLGDLLTKDRNFAYYSEREYGKKDARHARAYMQRSFETAKAFFSFE